MIPSRQSDPGVTCWWSREQITHNKLTGPKNAHIIALDIKKYISTDQSADGQRRFSQAQAPVLLEDVAAL